VRICVIAISLVVSACAGTVPRGSDEAAFIDDGARRVSDNRRAELLVGNRLEGDGFEVAYLPEGAKRIRTDDGLVLERRWWVREDGVFCEELAASGAPVCGGDGRLYVKDGRYRAFRPDGTAAPLSFTIAPLDGTS